MDRRIGIAIALAGAGLLLAACAGVDFRPDEPVDPVARERARVEADRRCGPGEARPRSGTRGDDPIDYECRPNDRD